QPIRESNILGAACRAVGRAWSAPLRWGRRGGLVVLFGILTASTLLIAGANPVHPVLAQIAPDLRPLNLAVSPEPPYEGDVVEVTVTVVNVGDTAAISATVELIDSRPNGDVVRIGVTPLSDSLAPGASALVHTPQFLAVGLGEHNLTIRVENVVPAEANAGYDTMSMWMQVLPARAPPPPPPPDGVRIEALATLGFGAFIGFLLVIGVIAVVIVFLSRAALRSRTCGPPANGSRAPSASSRTSSSRSCWRHRPIRRTRTSSSARSS